ncbi:T9SS C-terminal target domain-containing protein [Chryseobacterium phosphatilyticum]|uniref:T9SS C-terminal target domain-containing protein n=1 Tax=Chryseobacterium phosphatilyticum TaxID=475075 RepID=A0A316X860_9FLAO|nr:T9SS type A sorting domain-containing protein [Chryseobacterium phosphatilyticum]PWN70021.1 T9SS C-terminal target domain-containing protein [Chryseobacterium phosphatilyticum]
MKTSLFILLGTPAVFSAQITLTKATHDPVINDIVNNSIVTGTVDNSATGPNVTFSNGSLAQGASSQVTYSTPTATEIGNYPGSTIKMIDGTTTIFYKASATKLEITGIINPQVTLNFNQDNGTYIAYPTTYSLTAQSDTVQGLFSSSIANGLVKGTMAFQADAYGTLMVAGKTYNNVLRVKFTQNIGLYSPIDITFSNPLGTFTNTAYSYYDASHRYALLSSTSGTLSVPAFGINQTTATAQALNETFLAVGHVMKKANLSIYPNPAQDFIGFKGEVDNYSTAKIYSLDGKLVKTSEVKSGNVQISDLPPASYFIEVGGKNTETAKTTKFIKK